MSYATQQDLVDRFGERELVQLTDRADPPADAIDADIAARALSDADALIDSYIGKKYELPLSSTPDVLVGTACTIARFYLWEDHATEEVRKRYEEAVAWLKAVSRGDAVLGIAGAPAAPSDDGVLTEGPDRVFTRPGMDGY